MQPKVSLQRTALGHPSSRVSSVNRVALLLVPAVLMASPPCVAQFNTPPWPAGTKEAAVAGCRESILQQTEQDFLKRNNLKEFPPGLREKLTQAMEPFLGVCECAMTRIERRWSFEYFRSHQPEMLTELKELTVGECAPATNTTPGKAPASLP